MLLLGAHAHGPGGDLVGWLPAVLVAAVGVGAYLTAVARRARPGRRPWSGLRVAAWVTGTVLVAATVAPPAVSLAHDPRGHMAQHLVLGMLAPLALVLGAPVALALASVRPARARRWAAALRNPAVRPLAHPVAGAVLSVGGLYVLYLTPLYAATLRSPAVHAAVGVHLLVAGTLFTWSVAGPDPSPLRPGLRTRLTVLVLAAAAHAVLAKLLYVHAAALPPGGSGSVAEREVAARWMYTGGDVVEVLLAVAVLAGWYRRTRPRRGPSPGTRATRGTPERSRGGAGTVLPVPGR
ncbi:cytochrome c oxidase assembly protein [Cellulomonas fimi]|uniref:Cytochrome c oxidase caa3-type, assembly factor CtaG-related protein n=1 Tax=Cellulomonas fimi (strain ATCC 484 / DSM 20113 / JCM 1341 / CCUG 24087 / LMG 16345 / NBRC 15513 / NCIMB 8980 / NCTC 7547 / NRS-133) TaxID=590998 RepID=F4GZB8_CELFA|nr:cytochrome c oxidase assembly protein [Cellulomonas fimi]AEE44839.1 Cytochrome c oxidase caa3-type, assembly factor CtaG-related protein [Cellulomonas fimi ATCC 484]NNH09110.1 cytochrome c oxidase assembly protein [Cellulomonas fimi]VEH27443.1 Cytochrome c oxidase caa3 assembly factor (Caa3_CtaG) [Cellulomonas fimi]